MVVRDEEDSLGGRGRHDRQSIANLNVSKKGFAVTTNLQLNLNLV
jgi:hypothetical protein